MIGSERSFATGVNNGVPGRAQNRVGLAGAGFALTLGPTRFGTAWAAAGRRPTSNPVRGERSIMRGRGAGAVGGAGERRAVQPAKSNKRKTRRLLTNRPCSGLVYEESHSKRTSTRQQLGE